MALGTSRRRPITMVLVARVRLYRESLASMIGCHPGVRMAAAAATQAEVEAAVEELRPDVVVIDMATSGALDMTSLLRRLPQPPRVVAFAVDESVSAILDCAEAGAHGFVTATATLDEFVEALERVVAGELLCTPRVVAELFRGLGDRAGRRNGRSTGAAALTHREQQVLGLLTRGLSNKEIGASLNIAEATVKHHVHNLLEKLQVGSRGQAAACATLPTSSVRHAGALHD
jgi:DNA-binding NarL/FixJ family response regulator